MIQKEFKSQICTTREQSQRLLGIGLKPETADMVYHFTNSRVEAMQWELQTKSPTLRGKFWTPERIAKLKNPFLKHQDGTPMTGEQVFDSLWGKDVPAWSLSRLLELLPPYLSNCGTLYLCAGLHTERYNEDNKDIAHKYDVQYGIGTVTKRYENPFDAIIEATIWLIKNKYFNKDYLL